LTTENKNERGDHGTAESRHSKKSWLCNGRTDPHPANWKKRTRYEYGKRDDGVSPVSPSRDMCGNHHHESRLALGLLGGMMRRRKKSDSGSGGARDHDAGKSKKKMIFLSIERS
jgi:hypothetical protein